MSHHIFFSHLILYQEFFTPFFIQITGILVLKEIFFLKNAIIDGGQYNEIHNWLTKTDRRWISSSLREALPSFSPQIDNVVTASTVNRMGVIFEHTPNIFQKKPSGTIHIGIQIGYGDIIIDGCVHVSPLKRKKENSKDVNIHSVLRHTAWHQFGVVALMICDLP